MILPPALIDCIVDLACRIQQIPAPTFHEQERAEIIRQQLVLEERVTRVDCDDAGNVLALIPGEKSSPPLVISAHLDTVFPADTDLSILRSGGEIQGPGIGDNSLGVAALVLLARLLKENEIHLPGDLWLVGNVGEEGLGNLRGMRALVNRFQDSPSAYLVLEGLGLGEVFHRGLGVQRFRVTIHTGGGHSWIDAGQPSAIHESARLITSLTCLPLPRSPRTTLNIGVISGGTTVNSIAARTSFDVDMRCEEPAGLEQIWLKIERMIASAQKRGVQVTWEAIGARPAGGIPVDHPLVRQALSSIQNQGVEAKPGIGSTDANLPLSRGYPAISFGITRGSGAHTMAEYIEIKPIAQGMQALLDLVTRI